MFPFKYRTKRDGDKYRLVFREFAEESFPRYASMEEALANACQDLIGMLGEWIKLRKSIIAATDSGWDHDGILRLPILVQLKIALWNQVIHNGWSKAETARKLGGFQCTVDRLVDFTHNTRIEAVERAMWVAGIRANISVDKL